jgi:hypothetical protein
VRSVAFAEESVRLSNVIVRLRQLSAAPLVIRAADDLAQSFVVPELDGGNAATRAGQAATIDAVLVALGQRAATLRQAAEAVAALPLPPDTIYTPISQADAVILYAGNFMPSWAGAIAIDLLPAVLVLILAVTQSAIRTGREGASAEDTMSIKELRAALRVAREIEGAPTAPPPTVEAPPLRAAAE